MLVSAIMIAPTLGNCWSELLTSRVPSKQMWFDCRVAPTIVADNAGELATVSGEKFPRRTVTVWRGEKSSILSTGGALLDGLPAKVPDGIKRNFSGFVVDQDSLHLRPVKHYDEGGLRLTVISDVHITPELLQTATSRLGAQ